MAIDFDFILRNDALFEIILPFVLVFTIVFAVFNTTKILGGKKNIDAVISIVLGLLIIRNKNIIDTINRFLPNVALAIIVILMILLVLGVFLGKEYEWADGMKGFAAVVSLVLVLWIFGSSYWNRLGIPNIFSGLGSETKGILIFIAILVIVVWLVSRDDKEKTSGRELYEKFGKSIFKE